MKIKYIQATALNVLGDVCGRVFTEDDLALDLWFRAPGNTFGMTAEAERAISALNSTFGIVIPHEHALSLGTVRSLLGFIAFLLEQKNAVEEFVSGQHVRITEAVDCCPACLSHAPTSFGSTIRLSQLDLELALQFFMLDHRQIEVEEIRFHHNNGQTSATAIRCG
jgi:hypothetical protein